MQEAWVWSLIRELRSHMPCNGNNKNNKSLTDMVCNSKQKINQTTLVDTNNFKLFIFFTTWFYLLITIMCVCVCARAYALSHVCLCNPMNCSPPGSSLHEIFQARKLEWVAIFSSRGSSRHRDQTHISFVFCIADGFFAIEPLGKPTHHY